MLIENKKLTDLIPADYNPRKDLKPGDDEYEKLKRSIEQFGMVQPVIWNKTTGRVVGGHQRLKVLADMGYAETECVVVEMDEAQEKALNIALNKISGDWDKDMCVSAGNSMLFNQVRYEHSHQTKGLCKLQSPFSLKPADFLNLK